MLIVYTSKPRFSGANNWDLFKRHIDGDTYTIRFFDELKRNALIMQRALAQESIHAVSHALNEDWHTRRAILPDMSTPAIDGLMKEAMRLGATAGRVCGAGGGGCVLLLAPPRRHDVLYGLVRELGMERLPFSIAESGVTVHEK